MTAPDEHLPTEVFHVNANSELRIEVGEAKCYVTVTNGTAEVFGAVLQSHRRIELQHSKVAIFSWEGCSISLEGFPSEPAYISDDTPMSAYLNAAHIINNQRTAARDVKAGPVVAVIGPANSGKTSVVKLLLNYAIRSGWNPLLVETDVRHGMVTVPGALSAVQVEAPIEPDEGLLADAPVVLYYAHTDPEYNVQLYRAQIDRLAALCKERETSYKGRFQNLAAGTIVNTMGWVDGQGKDVLAHICRAFHADVVLVIGDDKLHSSMQAIFQGDPNTAVVKVPKSGGCVAVAREQHKVLRDIAIRDYFLGRDGAMTPAMRQLKLSDVHVFKAAGGLGSQAGLLPAGMAAVVDPTRVTAVPVTEELVGQLLAASYAEDASKVAVTNVAGFVWVQHVDVTDGSFSVMCPHATDPPTNNFLIGSVKRNLDLMTF